MKKIIKFFALTLASVMSCCIVGCGGTSGGGSGSESTSQEEPLIPLEDQTVWEYEFKRENDNLNRMTTQIDSAMYENCDERGVVESLEYDTYCYAYYADKDIPETEWKSEKKRLYVYLPYGYDESVKYDVLYLLHGGGDDAASWFTKGKGGISLTLGKGSAVKLLDNMIKQKLMSPCIVVTPGLYMKTDSYDETIPQTSGKWTENFATELRRDIIPAVESKYSTYIEGEVTDEKMVATREHRGFNGLSMGSITSWATLVKCQDIIAWFGNMSAGPSSNMQEAVAYMTEKILPSVTQSYEQGRELKMLIGFNGKLDMALDPHVAVHKEILEYCKTNAALKVGQNYDFLYYDKGGHNWDSWFIYLYNTMLVFFR